MSPNTDISAIIGDQHLSLLQIRQPQMIHNNVIVENSREDETMEGGGDTLARAMPGDTEDNRRFSS